MAHYEISSMKDVGVLARLLADAVQLHTNASEHSREIRRRYFEEHRLHDLLKEEHEDLKQRSRTLELLLKDRDRMIDNLREANDHVNNQLENMRREYATLKKQKVAATIKAATKPAKK